MSIGKRPSVTPTATARGESRRQYFFALDPGSAGGRTGTPRFVPIGVSTLERTSSYPQNNSRFALPRVSGQTLLATRLERLDTAGNEILDEARPRPDTSAEPATSPTAPAASAMTIIQSESLPPSVARSRFIIPTRPNLEAEGIASGDGSRDLAFVVTEPRDACGESQLHSFLLEGSAPSPQALTLADVVALPANDWQLVSVQPGYVLLVRFATYALFEWNTEGRLSLVSVRSAPLPLSQPQLRGTHLRGAAGLHPIALSF